MITERDVERVLCEQVRNLGGYAYKFTSPGNAGVPDRMVVLPNCRPIFVELKTETGKLEPIQTTQIKKLKKLGQTVYVVWGMGGVVVFLQQIGNIGMAEKIRARYGVTVKQLEKAREKLDAI